MTSESMTSKRLSLLLITILVTACTSTVTGGVPTFHARDESLLALLHGELAVRDECLVVIENSERCGPCVRIRGRGCQGRWAPPPSIGRAVNAGPY